MENILTFETGLLVGGLLIMMAYTFISTVIASRKIKSLEERLKNLSQEFHAGREDLYRWQSDFDRNHWDSRREMERSITEEMEHRFRNVNDHIISTEQKIVDCQNEYDRELSVFDLVLS